MSNNRENFVNLDKTEKLKNYAMLSYDKVDENLIKWHQRYGHLNINDLQKN